MFSRGSRELIDALPSLDELDGAWARRRLSEAYIDVLAARELVGSNPESAASSHSDLRRLIDALELYVLGQVLDDDYVVACSFVAAEALELRSELRAGGPLPDERVEAGLLFSIGGFDANAAAVVPVLEASGSPRQWCLHVVGGLLAQREPGTGECPPAESPDRFDGVERLLWQRIGEGVRAHGTWLRSAGETDDAASPGRQDLSQLRAGIRQVPGAEIRYAPAVHLLDLVLRAAAMTERRALRRLRGLPAMAGYVDATARRRPLLWPGAERFADECLPALDGHAAVAIPTGAGKSAIAELAAVRAAAEGWSIYLAPTNALVGQIRRDLHGAIEGNGGEVKAFVGGPEYLRDESIDEVGSGDLVVMTPERCSLALRQSPASFGSLRLLVVDECHTVGEGGTRGVITELVIAEILARAPRVSVVLMSALVSNAPELADWLHSATGRPAKAVDVPWRPTRTLRGVVGMRREAFQAARELAVGDLEQRPRRVSRHDVPLSMMVGLQGAWNDTETHEDFAMVGLPVTVGAEFRSRRPQEQVPGWRNRAAEALTIGLAAAGEHVLTFVPANKHEVIAVGRVIAESRSERELDERVEALIDLAEYELGSSSEVGDLLAYGVATHSAALIEDERRACELAFSEGQPIAPVMVATTSLAQGLNLPATVVVVAGTQIGTGDNPVRTARGLLNAIGRAGRPFVANRSLALIVPSAPVLFSEDSLPSRVASHANFVTLEDAASPLESQLLELLRRDPDQLASLEAMTEEELTAFTYLPLGDDQNLAERILASTLGHYQRRVEITSPLSETVAALGSLGGGFLDAADAPQWLVEVAYLSGIDLRGIAGLHRAVREQPERPLTVEDWARALVTWLSAMPEPARSLLCNLRDVPQPLNRLLAEGQASGWTSLAETTVGYLRGESLAELAEKAFDLRRADGRRAGTDPLPKAITLVREVFGYQMAMAAGGLLALFQVAGQQALATGTETGLELDALSFAALSELPLAIRTGCAASGARQWLRLGVSRRRLAHLLARIQPVPAELATEAAIRAWMRSSLQGFADGSERFAVPDEAARRAVMAAAQVM